MRAKIFLWFAIAIVAVNVAVCVVVLCLPSTRTERVFQDSDKQTHHETTERRWMVWPPGYWGFGTVMGSRCGPGFCEEFTIRRFGFFACESSVTTDEATIEPDSDSPMSPWSFASWMDNAKEDAIAELRVTKDNHMKM